MATYPIIELAGGQLTVTRKRAYPFSPEMLKLLRKISDGDELTEDEQESDEIERLYKGEFLVSQRMTWSSTHFLSELGREVISQLTGLS